MTPQIAALRIARSIVSVEADLDRLLVNASGLLGEIAAARVATGVDAHTMQQSIARIANLQRAMVEGRSELVRAHRDLSRAAQTMDIGLQCPTAASLRADEVSQERASALA
ncbi:hypothetical protein [Novosphingobium soli]|uniref:Flagellar protein FlgN n=1 Tax=Novosphingobium soli TaxID=574956 RepID=A0ABV6CY50_9SPHN